LSTAIRAIAPRLGFDQTLAAGVFVAIVAEHAVVDLGLDLAGAHPSIRQRESEPLPPLVRRADEELRHFRVGPFRLDEMVVVERARKAHRRPTVHGIARVGAPRRQPRLDRIERKRNREPEGGIFLPRRKIGGER
jgi:hypothetical protein